MKRFIWILSLAAVIGLGSKLQMFGDDKTAIQPGRHLSESQVADIAMKELPASPGFQFEFNDGVWDIREPQKDVWGVSSAITNSDGKVSITSTNATRLVLRVRDADGKVEPVKNP